MGPLLALTRSGLARGLGTFLSEGRTVTLGTVPGCGIILGTELLQVEEMQGNVVLQVITYPRAPWLTTQCEAGAYSLPQTAGQEKALESSVQTQTLPKPPLMEIKVEKELQPGKQEIRGDTQERTPPPPHFLTNSK